MGFRKDCLTTKACYDLMEEACNANNEGKITTVTFSGLVKSLHIINSEILITKLNNMGFKPQILR